MMAKDEACATCGSADNVRKLKISKKPLCAGCRETHRKSQQKKYRRGPYGTVKKAQVAFQRSRSFPRAKKIPSYESLLKKFRVGKTYQEIGDSCGLTKSRIEQIYSTYFRQVIPFRQAPKARKKKRKIARARKQFQSYFRVFIPEAKRHGIKKVEPVFRNYAEYSLVHFSRTLILCDGKLCRFSFSRQPSFTNGRPHYRIHRGRLRKAKCWISQMGDGKNYPYEFLFLPAKKLAKVKKMYVPIEGWSSYHSNTAPRADWLSYKGRWEYAGGTVSSSARLRHSA